MDGESTLLADFAAAIRRNDVEAVRSHLNSGVAVDSRDRYGQTGLMLAAHAGCLEVVQLFVERGAALDVTAKYGLSALMLAVVAGHSDVARALARAGADLALRGVGDSGFAGKTAGDLAVARGMQELSHDLGPE